MASLAMRALAVRALAAATAGALALPAVAAAGTPSLSFGGFGRDATTQAAAYAAANYAGARYARSIVERGTLYDAGGAATTFNWAPITAEVDAAVGNGLKPFLTLTNAHQFFPGTRTQLTDRQRIPTAAGFGAWCGEAASLYSQPANPKVLDYGAWNEPNLSGVGDLPATTYRSFYSACRTAIKAVNPNANVYFGELSSSGDACQYLADALPGSASAAISTEGVAIHPYQYNVHPTLPADGTACNGIGRLAEWRARIATLSGIRTTSGGRPPIVISEFGYCTDRVSGAYPAGSAQAACPQNAAGAANRLDDGTRAAWVSAAWQIAAANDVTIFNYHTLAKRPFGDWAGNTGYMWESGIFDLGAPYSAPLNKLRAATGVGNAADLSSPAATSWSSTRFDLFAKGEDGQIYHKFYDNGRGPVGGWSPWGTIGAPPSGAASSPTVTSPGTDVLQVFVRGGDNQIWNNHWTHGLGPAPGGWSGWGAVPNTGNATWAPAATNGGDETPDVFYTGTDGAVYYTRYDNIAGWVPPVSLGGVVSGSPAATTTVGNKINVFVRGSDDRVYHKYWDPSTASWVGWGAVPNAFTSMSPAATTVDGQPNVFFRAQSSAAMYHEYYNASLGWVGPGGVPGASLIATPAAAGLHTFLRQADGSVQQLFYDPVAGWVGPVALGRPF